ncbi:MAG: hypothetical protein ACOZBH_03675 [Patescibacteria group bacterium]
MPYLQPFTKDDLDNHRLFLQPKVFREVEVALARGEKVELLCSSFDDPGMDWTKIFINGRPVDGSFVPGY